MLKIHLAGPTPQMTGPEILHSAMSLQQGTNAGFGAAHLVHSIDEEAKVKEEKGSPSNKAVTWKLCLSFSATVPTENHRWPREANYTVVGESQEGEVREQGSSMFAS